MKVEIDKSKIEEVIQKVGRLSNKHLTLPVLSCIYIETFTDNRMVLRATNLDIGVEVEIKVKTINPGIVAVPANVIIGTISSIKDNIIVLESVDNNLKISSAKNSAIIKCLPHEDFPTIPKLDGTKSVKINTKDLINGFKSVWYSASNSNVKPELGSVFVYKDDSNLTFVSTDSFRLAEKKINAKIQNDFPDTLIPYKNVSEMIKLLEDNNEELEIIFEKNQAAFITKEMRLVSRLIDGSFPDYKQIIPKNFLAVATLLKSDLINSVKASNIFSDSLNQVRIKVDTKNKTLDIESKNNEVGEYKESIKAAVSGENIELNFNSKYVTDSMQSILSESVALSFGGAGKPLVIRGVSDNSFMYIAMPMNR